MFNMGTRQSREQADSVHDYTAHVTDANKTMALSDKVVLVTLTAANNSTVTLPSVSEAAGEIFIVRLVAVGSGAVTVADKANDAGMTDITLNAAGQYAVLCSDGQAWMSTLFSAASSSTTITSTGDATIGGDLVVSGGDIDAGASGSAGTVDVFPSTASKGKLAISCTDQTGNTTVSLVAGAMAAARTVTLRDPGAAASVLTTTDGTAAATTATAVELTRSCDCSTRLVAAGGTLSVTEALHSDRIILLDTATGSVCTLPDATGGGCRFRFIVKTKATSNAHIVKVPDANNLLFGSVNLLDNDAAAQTAYATAATSDTITLNGTTTGGQVGDYLDVIDIAADTWMVLGQLVCPAGSNPATPFSATVS